MSIKIKDFVKEFSEAFVYYDPAFQRRVVWLASLHGSKFVESLTKGWGTYSKIVVCDVRRSLKRADAYGDVASVEYFRKVLEDFEYISLDGQNRSKFVESLFENTPTISGKFLDADGKEIEVKNKFYKDLPIRLQDAISDASVDVCVVTVKSRSELAEIFQNLNSGVALNDQEKRNSLLTPIADWVRNLREKLKDALPRVVLKKEIPRMLDDELVAKMLMVLLGKVNGASWGLESKDVNLFYTEAKGFHNMKDPGFLYKKKAIARAETILSNWGLVIRNQKHYAPSQRVALKMTWATLYACAWAYDNHYLITNHSEFFKTLKIIDDKLKNDGATKYNAECRKLINAGKDPDAVPKGDYYDNWVSLPHQPKYRNKRIAYLSKEIAAHTRPLSLRLRGENKNGQVLTRPPKPPKTKGTPTRP